VKQTLKSAFPLLAAPLAYIAVLWGTGRLGIPSEWVTIALIPAVLVFAGRAACLRFSVSKRIAGRDVLLLVLLLAAAIGFSLLFPVNREAPGVGYVVAALLAAPLNEELLFRAFVLGRGREPFGRVAALLVSTALFAAAHSQPLPALLIGLLLGLLYLKYGSVTVPLIFHVLLNGFIMLL